MKYKILIILSLLLPCILSAQVEQVELLGVWEDSIISNNTEAFVQYNEVWGAKVNGVEYAIIGSIYGTHFISLKNPEKPVEVARLKGTASGSFIVHRDYDSEGNILYAVADEGTSSRLEIIDMSYLPDSVHRTSLDSFDLNRTHNIFLDKENDILYCCYYRDVNSGFSPLCILDVSDPYNPEIVFQGHSIDGIQFSQVHDMYIENDTAFFNCGFDGLVVADMSEVSNPKLITTLTDYPEKGYNHSGWYDSDSKIYYQGDETYNTRLKAIDFSDFENPEVVDLFGPGGQDPEDDIDIPHNQVVRGDYLYVSYYYDGYRVYDIATDPKHPELVGYYPTSTLPGRESYEGAWGVYPNLPSGTVLVSDIQNGLFVLQAQSEKTSSETIKLTSDIQLYPNPARDRLNVNVKFEEPYNLQIFNSVGNSVYSKKNIIGATSVVMNEFQAGEYIVIVKSNGKTVQQKIIHF